MSERIAILIVISSLMVSILGFISILARNYSLNKIKSKIVGDGQFGTAKFATKQEIDTTFDKVPYEVEKWRKGGNLPKVQGIVIGCESKGKKTVGLVDKGDVHCLMIGAAGVGKTAF